MTDQTYPYPRFVRILINPGWQAVFAVITLIAVLALDAFVYFWSPYDGLDISSGFDTFGRVEVVLPNSPAEHAGVQTGDVLLSIEDKSLNPWLSRPVYSLEDRAGDFLTYTFEREGRLYTTSIQLGSNFENAEWFLPSFWIHLLSVFVWGVGAVLCLFAHRTDVSARLIGLTFLIASVTIAAGQSAGWNAFWGINTTRNILWSVLGPVSVAAHLTFPVISFPKSYRRWVVLLGFVALGLAGISVFEGWVLFPRQLALREFVFGLGSREVVLLFFLGAQLINIGLLFRHRFFSENSDVRRQVGIVLWGTALGFVPFLALDLLPYLFFGESYVSGILSFLPVFMLPLTYTYLSYQRKLLKLDFIINRAVVLFTLALLVLFAAVTSLGIVTLLFDLSPDLPLLGGLAVVLFALPSASMQKAIQRRVNQVLYGSHYDFESITSNFSGRLAQTLDRNTLTEFLTAHLNAQMGITCSTLFLLEENCLIGQANRRETLALDDPLCQMLLETHRPVRVSELQFGSEHSPWASYAWAQIWVPLVIEKQLLGILLLGDRIASDLYSDQDIAILATVAYQAALAYTNVQMVESLRDSKHLLVRFEHEYRKRLARDLHDTMLQDLFFVKRRLLKGAPPDDVAPHLDKVIGQLRHTIEDQRSALLDQGLRLALEGMVDEMRIIAGKKPAILFTDRTDEPMKLSEEQTTSLYRIAKEAVTNALKHSQAERITVCLEKIDMRLRIAVTDNGIGFPSDTCKSKPSHYGFLGMQERASLINARLNISSQPGKGTTISAELNV